uniref:Cation efflux protein transmembrane domain-containing protein n=1 Tax=Timema bartmani TaxID=61472 RepID=A0A7R9ESP6_9NEOP|nr:unnamed protein product [Timema bartmani]
MCIGAVGILLNGLCYLLIGGTLPFPSGAPKNIFIVENSGYTFRQNSFLHVTPSGDIALDHVATSDPGTNKLPTKRRAPHGPHRPWEILRDIISSLLVIVCSIVVYFTDQQVAKFVDPLISIVSAVSLIVLTYPYMKESGQILLQTIPDSINVESLCSELQRTFPEIVNIHELHIWQLKATNIYSTVHIIFRSYKDYIRINKDITDFFLLQGITQLTLQPEFYQFDLSGEQAMPRGMDVDCCLIPCLEQACKSRHCCQEYEDDVPRVSVMGHQHCHLQTTSRKPPPLSETHPRSTSGNPSQTCHTKASTPSETQPRSSSSDPGSLLPGSRPQDIKASEACSFRTDGGPQEPEEYGAGTRSHSDTEDENSEERNTRPARFGAQDFGLMMTTMMSQRDFLFLHTSMLSNNRATQLPVPLNINALTTELPNFLFLLHINALTTELPNFLTSYNYGNGVVDNIPVSDRLVLASVTYRSSGWPCRLICRPFDYFRYKKYTGLDQKAMSRTCSGWRPRNGLDSVGQ